MQPATSWTLDGLSLPLSHPNAVISQFPGCLTRS
ncbi:hypothetical protein I7I48_01089 [Histoplasma ohiense]|nr:hypothetical protein I7I48_01089 [Histoplasma ohiense (nom. inval.)]